MTSKYLIFVLSLVLVTACSNVNTPHGHQEAVYMGSIELSMGETGLQVQSNELLACASISVGESTVDTSTGFSFSVPYTITTDNCDDPLSNLGLIPLNLPNTVGNSPLVSGATPIPQDVAESIDYIGVRDVSTSASELNAALESAETALDLSNATIIPSAFVDGNVAFTTSASFSGSMVVGVFALTDTAPPLPGF